jgi:hypothetical protein
MDRSPLRHRLPIALLFRPLTPKSLRGISPSFDRLSPGAGQVSYVLLTRAPLSPRNTSISGFPFDLHVLGTPPAFILSQDQTLRKKSLSVRLSITSKVTGGFHSLYSTPHHSRGGVSYHRLIMLTC